MPTELPPRRKEEPQWLHALEGVAMAIVAWCWCGYYGYIFYGLYMFVVRNFG